MLKVENLCLPDTAIWDTVIMGMRNAFKSNDKHDSTYCYGDVGGEHPNICGTCDYQNVVLTDTQVGKVFETECGYDMGEEGFPIYALGPNDFNLALNLVCSDSPSHRKYLRQLPVVMDITAPLYFWKQLDSYKVGTVTNSESTMHTLTKYPFKIEDFSIEYFDSVNSEKENWFKNPENDFWGLIENDANIDLYEYFKYYNLGLLNSLRDKYLKTKDMNYWYLINQLLPQSYNQKRTWSANYEVLMTIIHQRKGHPLKEWKTFIDFLLENVPYLKMFCQEWERNNKTVKELKEDNLALQKDIEALETKVLKLGGDLGDECIIHQMYS